MPFTVVILGGYGTFGGRLARLLADDERVSIVVAGRSKRKADAFCDRWRGKAIMRGAALDREGDLVSSLRDLAADAVVDASGPFQVYRENPYGVVEACLALKIGYIDLADGSAFVAGIDRLDNVAKQAGIFVLSGASTLPVLSTSVVRRLSNDRPKEITIGIAPSPHIEIGRNVVRAIASYAGKPVGLPQGTRFALIDRRNVTIAPPGVLPLHSRRFALADVPDYAIATRRWPGLSSLWAGVGTEPVVWHRGLSAFSWLVRLRLLPSLSLFVPLFHAVANKLTWGEARGGMFVSVRDADDITRHWYLIADGNLGPFVPAIAAKTIVAAAASGKPPYPGARAAIDDVSLDDYEREFSRLGIGTGVLTRGDGPLYRRLLGPAFDALPPPIRTMHDGVRRASGRATVERGHGLLARLVAGIMRFPAAGTDVPVTVRFDIDPAHERWTRTFAGRSFFSLQYDGRGRADRLLCERFGLLTFALALVVEDGKLRLMPRHWSILGIPLPRFLLPEGDTYESSEDGRFHFHVEIGFPWTGLIVRYRGWLVPDGIPAPL